jgi:hypothetical protein
LAALLTVSQAEQASAAASRTLARSRLPPPAMLRRTCLNCPLSESSW